MPFLPALGTPFLDDGVACMLQSQLLHPFVLILCAASNLVNTVYTLPDHPEQIHVGFGKGEDSTVSWSTQHQSAGSCVEYTPLRLSLGLASGLHEKAQASQGVVSFDQQACGSSKVFTDGGDQGYQQARPAPLLFHSISRPRYENSRCIPK